MAGGSVGQVISSKNDKLHAGDYVESGHGWRDYFVVSGQHVRKIDPDLAPIQAYLGTVGMPGRTAYIGLLEIGRLKEGDTVFVSGAAGAVGAVACQIARIKGCRVIGSAGSDSKVRWLKDVAGIDAAFNYKSAGSLKRQLTEAAPEGIDLYFDNVGGAHLEAALTCMNRYGRVACCGMISQYNTTGPEAAPRNLSLIVGKRLMLKGFIVSDHREMFSQFYADMKEWIASGEMKWQETIIEGLENAPQAFIGLFSGENLGKMLVKVGPDPAI
jgi:NADPH-dependent curcumin reductase CurA